jgi:hypothetical protein
MGIEVTINNFFLGELPDIPLNVDYTYEKSTHSHQIHKKERIGFFLDAESDSLEIIIDPKKRKFIMSDYWIDLPRKAKYIFEDPSGKAEEKVGYISIPKDDTNWKLTVTLPKPKTKDIPMEETKDNVTIGDIEPGGGD